MTGILIKKGKIRHTDRLAEGTRYEDAREENGCVTGVMYPQAKE